MLPSRYWDYAMNSIYPWQQFYERALLETDRSRLPVLIRAAQAAIDVRVSQLRLDSHPSPREQQAIEDAVAGLRVLGHECDSKVN